MESEDDNGDTPLIKPKLGGISRKKFRERSHILERRLDPKQRLSFDFLVERGIHGGMDDIYLTNKQVSKNGLMLNLHRGISSRLQPSQIQANQHVVQDLKIADSEYFQLYGKSYRNATPADTRPDPSPKPKPTHGTARTNVSVNMESAIDDIEDEDAFDYEHATVFNANTNTFQSSALKLPMDNVTTLNPMEHFAMIDYTSNITDIGQIQNNEFYMEKSIANINNNTVLNVICQYLSAIHGQTLEFNIYSNVSEVEQAMHEIKLKFDGKLSAAAADHSHPDNQRDIEHNTEEKNEHDNDNENGNANANANANKAKSIEHPRNHNNNHNDNSNNNNHNNYTTNNMTYSAMNSVVGKLVNQLTVMTQTQQRMAQQSGLLQQQNIQLRAKNEQLLSDYMRLEKEKVQITCDFCRTVDEMRSLLVQQYQSAPKKSNHTNSINP